MKNYYTTCEEIIRRGDWSRNLVTVSFTTDDGEERKHLSAEVDIQRDKAAPISITSHNLLATMQLEHFTRWLRDGNVAAEL